MKHVLMDLLGNCGASSILYEDAITFYASSILSEGSLRRSKLPSVKAQQSRRVSYLNLRFTTRSVEAHFLRFMESKIHTPTCASRRQVVEDSEPKVA